MIKFSTDEVITEDDFLKSFGHKSEEFPHEPDEKKVKELEKQEQENEQEDNYYNDDETDTVTSVDTQKIKTDNLDGTNLLINSADGFLAFIMSLIAHDESIKDYKLNEKNKDEIVRIVSQMMPEHKLGLPLPVQLILAIIGSYAPITARVISNRKLQLEIKKLEDKEKEHKLKYKELELKNKELELEKKQNQNK